MAAFVSYSRDDGETALAIALELRKQGASIWVDQIDIRAGHPWDSEIERALRSCDWFVVFLTPNAVVSQNVLDEVSFAIENKKRIVPVLVAKCERPLRLHRLQYIDYQADPDEAVKDLTALLAQGKAFPRKQKITPNERRLESLNSVGLGGAGNCIENGAIGSVPVESSLLSLQGDEKSTTTFDILVKVGLRAFSVVVALLGIGAGLLLKSKALPGKEIEVAFFGLLVAVVALNWAYKIWRSA